MDTHTLIVYLVMYIYGFSLMIWAIFLDKKPTKKTRYAAIAGLAVLILTVIYVAYVLWTVGVL